MIKITTNNPKTIHKVVTEKQSYKHIIKKNPEKSQNRL